MSAIAAPRIPRTRLKTIDVSARPGLKPTYERPKPPQALPKPKMKKINCCATPNISSDDGTTVCYSCGYMSQESAIVSEVTFGETAGGAAMVEGGFIGENQRHANSMGGTMRGLGGMASREQAEFAGRQEIAKIGGSLNVSQLIQDQALGWYKLAMNYRFIQGRRMRNVAAVAIYMAARRQVENTLMLMDLAEKVQVNVWALGDTYKSFLKKLGEEDPAQLIGNRAVQEIEPLMLKYCRKLEFGEDAYRVANDACKLLKRMNRDWMVQGRQPAGLAGACIILAARMNNFRRTVREVVYVVKVADSTINSRLYEYKQTPSSALTVNQFREFGDRMKVKTLPPAIWRREKKEERKQKRKAAALQLDSAEEVEASGSEVEAGPSTAPTRTSKRRKNNHNASQTIEDGLSGAAHAEVEEEDVLDGNAEAVLADLDGAMVDAGTADPEDEAFMMPKKRGRPKKREVIVVRPEDLEIEQEIESEVTHFIKDWESIFKEINANDNHYLLRSSGWTAQQMARAELDRRDIEVSNSPDIDEDEFEDDPDVANCILGPEEVRIKERIWITENEEWLRNQQRKLLEAELELAEDKPKKPKQKRRHHQMGDGSLLKGQPATCAADATHKMLKKRGKVWSNYINYDKLKEMFPGGDMSATPSGTGSGQGASPAASQPRQTSPAIEVQEDQDEDEDAEGDEDEEYEAQQPQPWDGDNDEDEDEHNYMEDIDEGFGQGYANDY